MKFHFAKCIGQGLVLAAIHLAGCSSNDAGPGDGDASVAPPDALMDDDGGRDAANPTGDAGSTNDAAHADDASDASASADTAPLPTYVNPVDAIDFPDPFVLRQGTTYYAFATNGAGHNVQAARSADLAHWSAMPDALPVLPSWAAKNASLTWAPSVLQRGASFVMYYTARDTASGFQCISHAESSTPGGPYVDSSTGPFICQVSGADADCGSIDPSPFVDDDGTAYLVWKTDENAAACNRAPRLWSAALAIDGKSLAGPATNLLTMDRSWQSPIIEGPSMTAEAGVYYLLYSANAYESASYSMGYATCLSAIGPCTNRSINGPAVSSAGTALGPGGGEFFADEKGDRWLAYHAWTAPSTTYASGGARSLRIDRVSVAAGVLTLSGPTTTPQPL